MKNALIATTITFGAAALSQAFSSRDVPEQYQALKKPSWAPPASVFAPVWSVLYASLAAATAAVLNEKERRDVRWPLALFGAQLAANAAWSPLFFRLKAYRAAEADAIAIAALVAATCASYARVRPAAGAALLPLLAWCSFAALLTHDIRRRNEKT